MISASIAPISDSNRYIRKRKQSPVAKDQPTAMGLVEELAVIINWDEVANDLSKGVLDRLDRATVARIKKLSRLSRVQKFAASSNADPVRVIIALLAIAGTKNSTRSAMRVATALGRLIDTAALQRLREELRTEAFSADVA
jgi:hypothetical protein